MPAILRNICFVVIGLSMGTGVTPEVYETARQWPLSFVLLAISVCVILVVCRYALQWLWKQDSQTAILSSTPGSSELHPRPQHGIAGRCSDNQRHPEHARAGADPFGAVLRRSHGIRYDADARARRGDAVALVRGKSRSCHAAWTAFQATARAGGAAFGRHGVFYRDTPDRAHRGSYPALGDDSRFCPYGHAHRHAFFQTFPCARCAGRSAPAWRSR